MRHASVILEVSPSRLTVAVVRAGKVASSRTQRFDITEWPQPWTSALAARVEALRSMVLDLQCADSPTTIIYAAPGSLASVVSCPASAGIANAERAARLALANVADFPIEISTTGTTCLLRESTPRKSAAPGVPNTHILAAADSEDRTQALCDWAADASLNVLSIVNAEALALAHAVRLVTAKGDDAVRATLLIDEHSAVLAAGLPGRVLLVRSLSIGSESLVESLTATLRSADPGAPGVTLSRDQARRVLNAVGIPAPDQPIANHPELQGSSLLPHLQPTIQRLSVEIKQSLRFSIPELLRPSIRLGVTRIGNSVPRLDEVLARGVGIPSLPASETQTSPSFVDLYLESRDLRINIAPREVRAISAARKLRTALMAGVGCAALLVGFEYVATSAQLASERTKLNNLNTAAQQGAQSNDSLQKAVAAEAALRLVDARIRSTLADSPVWPELLAFLAKAPSALRLTSIELRSESGAGHRAVIAGRVSFSDAPDAPDIINRFISSLSSLPITLSARLGGTQRSRSDLSEVQNFEINLTLFPMPAQAVRPSLASATEVTSP